MPAQRHFLALTPPPAVRASLAALAEPLAGVAWTKPEQLHVTLRFLGDVPEEAVDPLIGRLAGVRVGAFILPLEGAGSFPPDRPPRVLWLGVGRGHPRLFQLRQRIDDAVLATGLPLDVRTFHPHVTLARCAEGAAGTAIWLRTHHEAVAPPFRVGAFELYSSELHPEGAVHTLRHRFPLAD